MEAVIGALLLLLDPFSLGPATHGDVQLDECLIITGWGVDEAVIVWGSHTCWRGWWMWVSGSLRSRLNIIYHQIVVGAMVLTRGTVCRVEWRARLLPLKCVERSWCLQVFVGMQRKSVRMRKMWHVLHILSVEMSCWVALRMIVNVDAVLWLMLLLLLLLMMMIRSIESSLVAARFGM